MANFLNGLITKVFDEETVIRLCLKLLRYLADSTTNPLDNELVDVLESKFAQE
tara:strand:+ start:533 stop:691 length:159 start_codon:yes stop_codon:yes gene_type:complete